MTTDDNERLRREWDRGAQPRSEGSGGPPRGWLLPVVTFVLGALIGVALMGLARSGSGDDQAKESPPAGSTASSAASPSQSPLTTTAVVVPSACLAIADQAQELQGLMTTAATAARDLDASKLSDMVRQVGQVQAQIRASTADCRAAASSATIAR